MMRIVGRDSHPGGDLDYVAGVNICREDLNDKHSDCPETDLLPISHLENAIT